MIIFQFLVIFLNIMKIYEIIEKEFSVWFFFKRIECTKSKLPASSPFCLIMTSSQTQSLMCSVSFVSILASDIGSFGEHFKLFIFHTYHTLKTPCLLSSEQFFNIYCVQFNFLLFTFCQMMQQQNKYLSSSFFQNLFLK